MLGCCHCLCSKEYSAYTRVESCYPNDGRPEPVYARVRELVNWGSHDVDRFSSIHEIIGGRIRQDIAQKNDNGVAVGLKILATLLERVRELNLIITTTMTASIVQLIETKRPSLLQIASAATSDLIEHSINHVLLNNSTSVPFQRIIYAYIELLKDESLKETAYQAIADIAQKTDSIEALPIDDILKAIRPNFPAENAARNVLKSIAKVVAPLTLSRMTASIFSFFNTMNLWQDEDFMTALILVLFTEMPENCTPAFFKSWLEQLPPRTAEAGHSKTIINITVRLVEQVQPARLVSQAQTDALNILLMFVLKLPQLMYSDKEAILESALVIERFVVSHIPQPELLKIAHRQIWEWLPEKTLENTQDRVSLIFRFAAVFNDAAKAMLTKSMAVEGLNAIKAYLVTGRADEAALGAALEYFRALYESFPAIRSEAVLGTLLPLQKDAKKLQSSGQTQQSTALHTFVMCAMTDNAREAPAPLHDYVQEVVQARLDADPPQIDRSLGFAAAMFPQPPSRADAEGQTPPPVTIFFKKKRIQGCATLRRFSSVVISSANINLDSDDEEESEFDRPTIPSLVFPNRDEEASEVSVAEPPGATFGDAVAKQAEASSSIAAFQKQAEALELVWQSTIQL